MDFIFDDREVRNPTAVDLPLGGLTPGELPLVDSTLQDLTFYNGRIPHSAAVLVAKIEAVFESIFDAMLAEQPTSITLRIKQPPRLISSARSAARPSKPWNDRIVSLPAKTKDESRRFGMVPLLMENGSDCSGASVDRPKDRRVDVFFS